jgi:hypothetical protein
MVGPLVYAIPVRGRAEEHQAVDRGVVCAVRDQLSEIELKSEKCI